MTVTAPEIVPVEDGAKVTLTVHLACAAKALPHGLLPLGVDLYCPLGTMLVMARLVLWLLVSVTVRGALTVPTGVAGKTRLLGEKLNAETPVPDML